MKTTEMEILKRKIENTITSFEFENKVSIDICWFDKNSFKAKVPDPVNSGEKKFTFAIKFNKEIHENGDVSNQKNNEIEDNFGSDRSSPCVVFHSTKLFKVLI